MQAQQLDPSRNIGYDTLILLEGCQAFIDNKTIVLPYLSTISLGQAYERVVYPTLSKGYNIFDFSRIIQPIMTKGGVERSPSLFTHIRRMGLINATEDYFELSPIGYLLLNNRLSIRDYSLILISKLTIFDDDDNPCGNLLTSIIKQLIESKRLLENEIETYGARKDLILNALRHTLLYKDEDGYFSIPSSMIEFAKTYLKLSHHIKPSPIRQEDSDYFRGSLEGGFYDIVNQCNNDECSVITRFIPNLKNKVVTNSQDLYQGTTTQTIFYGCPGTGKSYKVKTLTEGDEGQFAVYFDENGKRRPLPETETERLSTPSNVFRTTFHPDYDYASFVGTYKPLMNENNELIYDFVPQVFTKAYIRAYQSLSDDTLLGNDKNVYLIIEEINRGNCAQIFGDLFQLLDRKDGWSDYSITPDTELKDYLSKLEGVPSDKLRLPGNLHILATMNTSDQSLFPMDSAFKRRWAMEYIPIKYEETDSNKAKDFILTLYGKEYKWLEFLKKANALIRKATDSEDKQMGEYFIKSSIDETEFINKVMFYIWNDVCKDHYSASSRISRGYFMRNSDKEKDIFTFAELFSGRAAEGEVSEATPEQLITNFMKHIGVDEENKPKENATTETEQIAEQQ